MIKNKFANTSSHLSSYSICLYDTYKAVKCWDTMISRQKIKINLSKSQEYILRMELTNTQAELVAIHAQSANHLLSLINTLSKLHKAHTTITRYKESVQIVNNKCALEKSTYM